MTPSPFVPLGRVVKTHGLKGEVAVAPAADLPVVLPTGLQVWFVPPPARVRTASVESTRDTAKGLLAKLSGIDDISTAEQLVGREIVARESDLPDGWDDADEEFDPIGLVVSDVERGELGEVVELIITGANDVWVVEGEFGEVLLPVIDDVILDIDDEAGTATVKLLPGLLPEEFES